MLSEDDRNRCRCCRAPVFGQRVRFRVCSLCDLCEDKHGIALHNELAALHGAGKIDGWYVVAASLLDDAWLTGHANIRQDGIIHVMRCPKRWEVWIAWCRAARIPITETGLVQGAISPWMGRANIAENRAAMQAEIEIALREAKSQVTSIRLNFENCTAIIDHVNIDGLIPREPDPRDVLFQDMTIGVPEDIASKPRGSA